MLFYALNASSWRHLDAFRAREIAGAKMLRDPMDDVLLSVPHHHFHRARRIGFGRGHFARVEVDAIEPFLEWWLQVLRPNRCQRPRSYFYFRHHRDREI